MARAKASRRSSTRAFSVSSRPRRTWAGLRSFAPDDDFVIGWDARREGFFWLAGQGGYGIQSAFGYSLLACNLLRGEPLDARLAAQRVQPERLSPARCQRG